MGGGRHQSGNIGAPSAFDGGQTQVEHANTRLCPRGCKCCSRAGRLSRTREIKGKWKRTAGSKPRSGSARRGNNQFHISRGAITSPAPPKAAPFVPLTIARKRRRYYSRGSVTFQDKCGELMAPPPTPLHPASTGRPRGRSPHRFTCINCGNEDGASAVATRRRRCYFERSSQVGVNHGAPAFLLDESHLLLISRVATSALIYSN